MKHPIKAIIALLLRLYLGYDFLTAGIGKWQTGFDAKAVGGFLKGGLAQTHDALLASKGAAAATHANVTDTWGWLISHVLLPNAGIFALVVKSGEVLIGLGLILGCFTTLAAFFGMMMNFCFLLTGTVSTNPQMVLGFLLIIVLGAASYEIGLDRFFMKKLTVAFPRLNKGWLRTPFPIEQ
ncbi:DoxX family membrane protein [Desulfosporosinus sp. Sb-LF]|uniref:DoxX family membrane protein n=1 Tax=Desulfosporosinus sp. Sb-LF TaxID=2560027 RepID=UPI00107F6378|nr:DoxX family membrane protein [Desulfosporosinus sp. Sb-LF]TGE32958.1 DoxX family membrane protein [Desulfosporosinus sp. Sb-LF]